MAASAVAECTFVRDQLKLIGLENLFQLFKDNEIDKEAFLLLDGLALTTLIPGKMGIQLKILKHIQTLQVTENKNKTQQVVNDFDQDKTQLKPKHRTQTQGYGQTPADKSKYTWSKKSVGEVSSTMSKNDRFDVKNKGHPKLNGGHEKQKFQAQVQPTTIGLSQSVKPTSLFDIDTTNKHIVKTPGSDSATTDIKMANKVNVGLTAFPKPNEKLNSDHQQQKVQDQTQLIAGQSHITNKPNDKTPAGSATTGIKMAIEVNGGQTTSPRSNEGKFKFLTPTSTLVNSTQSDGNDGSIKSVSNCQQKFQRTGPVTRAQDQFKSKSKPLIETETDPAGAETYMLNSKTYKNEGFEIIDLVGPNQPKNKISIQDLTNKSLDFNRSQSPSTNNIQPPGPVAEKTNQIDFSIEKVVDTSKLEHLMPILSLDKPAKPKKIPNKIVKHRESLPIFGVKNDLIERIRKNQVVVVVGETGSGKSTQIPQYLLEHEFAKTAKIACTEPRRLAAESLAKRAALEHGCELGDKIGFKIRFKNETSAETLLIYMTDGMLLNEITRDPLLYNYSVIILDEAHERNINTDISFGLIKLALKKRPDLKLIISSATLNTKKFASYFYNAPVFDISGRTFPVEVIYCGKPEPDYMSKATQTVCRIHATQEQGDILLFLTGQDEIEHTIEILTHQLSLFKSIHATGYELYPCYASLAPEYQQEIFNTQRPGIRKIVVATNIAETSITIDGVAYVVDSGVVKVNVYNPRTGVSSLEVQEISKAQADQRKGRAGRTKAGKCYRLYSSSQYDAFKEIAVPEIKRKNVDSVILHLVSVGIQDVIGFDFLDSPSQESIITALNLLKEIGAVDKTNNLTYVGRQMVKFPLDPTMAKSLIVSESLYCSEEVIILVSMLSARTEKLFINDEKQRKPCEQSKNRFKRPEGDQITYIDIFKQWRQNNFSKNWCTANYLQLKTLEEAEEIRNQIVGLMEENNIRVISSSGNYSAVLKALCSGFFRNIAVKTSTYGYKIIGKTDTEQVFIHPGSVLFKDKPDYLLFHEVVKTKKAYMRDVIEIKREWVEAYAREFYVKNAASFFIR